MNIINIILKSGSRNDPYSFRYFARPLAYVLTLLLSKHISANSVTYIRAMIVLLTLYFFSTGEIFLFKLAASLVVVNSILDCLDGSIARKNNSATYWGKFLDGFVDGLLYPLIPLAGAISLLHQELFNLYLIYIFIFSAFIGLLEQSIMNKLSFYREWIKNKENIQETHLYFYSVPKLFFSKIYFDIHHFTSFVAIFLMQPIYYFLLISLTNSIISLIRLINLLIAANKNINLKKNSNFISLKDINDKEH